MKKCYRRPGADPQANTPRPSRAINRQEPIARPQVPLVWGIPKPLLKHAALALLGVIVLITIIETTTPTAFEAVRKHSQ